MLIMVIFLTIFYSIDSFVAQNDQECFSIIKVMDGDSFLAKECGTGKREEARLWGIDAPEWKQDYGDEAKKQFRKLVAKKKVDIKSHGYDTYNRLLATVYLPGENQSINQTLIENGYAWVHRRYCTAPICKEWLKSEERAKRSKKGLWQAEKPVAPWVHKRNR